MVTCSACDSALHDGLVTSGLKLSVCADCGTFVAEHLQRSAVTEPWNSAGVSDAFLQALAARRAIQSEQIILHFRKTLAAGPVLDYGCGQGIFLKALAERGFNASGCDMSRTVTGQIDPRFFHPLSRPWEVPESLVLSTVVLLDVLEHNPDPRNFLETLKAHGARRLIVKVPLASGPMFKMALLFAKAGRPDALERLFLVGDPVPHYVYYTAHGLQQLFHRSGFRLESRLNLAEVGRELPVRVRSIPPGWLAVSALLRGFGRVVEMASRWWPDTSVFLFERDA